MFGKKNNHANGLELLIFKYKEEFRKPENLNYYSKQDFIKAERRYLAFRLNNC